MLSRQQLVEMLKKAKEAAYAALQAEYAEKNERYQTEWQQYQAIQAKYQLQCDAVDGANYNAGFVPGVPQMSYPPKPAVLAPVKPEELPAMKDFNPTIQQLQLKTEELAEVEKVSPANITTINELITAIEVTPNPVVETPADAVDDPIEEPQPQQVVTLVQHDSDADNYHHPLGAYSDDEEELNPLNSYLKLRRSEHWCFSWNKWQIDQRTDFINQYTELKSQGDIEGQLNLLTEENIKRFKGWTSARLYNLLIEERENLEATSPLSPVSSPKNNMRGSV